MSGKAETPSTNRRVPDPGDAPAGAETRSTERRRFATVSTVFALAKHQRGYMALLFAVMLSAALAEGFGLSLVIPLISDLVGLESESSVFSRIFDHVLAWFPQGYELIGLLALLVVAFGVKGFLMVLQTGLSTHFAMRLRARWGSRIFGNYLHAPYATLVRHEHGTLAYNTVTETMAASKAVVLLLQVASRAVVSTVLIAMLLFTNALMVLLLGIAAGAAVYFGWGASQRYSQRFGKERLRLMQRASATATEALDGVREVKLYGDAERQGRRLTKTLERFSVIQTKFRVLSTLPSNLNEFFVVTGIAVLLVAFSLVHGENVRDVIPVLSFFMIVAQRLLVYLSFVIMQCMKVAALVPSLNLMLRLTTQPQTGGEGALSAGRRFERLTTGIELREVDFSYNREHSVFRALNLSIPKGKTVGLIGSSGSGKSTVADLVMRLFEPDSGQVLIDGQDVRDWDLTSWRTRVSYVSQDPVIFNGTVRDNIRIGDPNAGEEAVKAASELASLDDFVKTLPEGYETIVGERGATLSGGQKQRIALARAILRDPELFIFDEATSALDSETEATIQRAIRQVSKGKTSLVIAHRRSALSGADLVYELDDSGGAVRRDGEEMRLQKLA